MQISDLVRGVNTAQTVGKTAEIKQDQVVNASIKYKLSSDDAVVEINGQEYKASFEKGVPRGERTAVQVTGRSGDALLLREIQPVEGKTGGLSSPDVQAEKLLRDAGMKITPDIKEAVSRLIAEKFPVTKDALQSVQHIIQEGEGSIQQKLDTLSVMARKRISITPAGYDAVFRVKHGPTLDRILNELAKEVPDLLPNLKDSRVNSISTMQPNGNSKLSQQLDTVAQAVKSQQSVNKEALRQLAGQIKQSPELPKLPAAIQQKVERVVQQMERAVRETPASQPTVTGQRLTQAVDQMSIEQAAKEVGQQAPRNIEQPGFTVVESDDSYENAKPVLNTSLQDLVKIVQDIRVSGRASRAQATQLQEAVEKVMQEANLSPSLTKDMLDLNNRLIKDLRMSASYEAVGRNAEAKVMVEHTLDTMIQMFKIPVSQNITGKDISEFDGLANLEGNENSTPQFLRPVSETFLRLGNIVNIARQEVIGAMDGDQSSEMTPDIFNVSRNSQEIVRDLANTLREATVREALPREEARKMQQMLQQLESITEPSNQLSVKDNMQLVDGLNELEQMLMQAGERIAALSAVQTANFEKVSHYIPDHLREVGNEFKQMKKEIVNNVNRMTEFLERKVPQAASYIKRIIDPTIEMVNRFVNKGEFALFADMEFEHNVLRISGELQQVKGLLDKGKVDDALQAFHRARADLDKLNWQPSYMKVERFFSKMTGEGAMQNPLQLYGQQWREESLAGRGVQEWMRGMGLNHERDAMDWMAQREGNGDKRLHAGPGALEGDARSSQNGTPHNFKSMLMEGMEGNNASPRAREMMEQALSNVTGQQLLSKPDPNNSVQSMYVQLPVPWEQGTQSVQVQINSRNNGEQMDWENCNLFFFLDTPKFGETGISINVVNREMSLRVHNDSKDIQQAFNPYISTLKEQLHGLGYHIIGLTFEPAARPAQGKEQEQAPEVDVALARAKAARYSTQEGVDYSV